MNPKPPINISIAANIWAHAASPDKDPGCYAAADELPGDLRVDLLGTRDRRVLERMLTSKQFREYCYCRFFAPYGHEGTAYSRI